MRKRIIYVLGIMLIGGTVLFLMLQVLMAQILADLSVDFSALTLFGFALQQILAVILTEALVDELEKRTFYYAGIFALLTNIVMWVSLSYFGVFRAYPDVWFYPDAEGFWYLFARFFAFFYSIPEILQTFSLYVIGSLPIFWEWTLITYVAFQTGFYISLTGGTKRAQ